MRRAEPMRGYEANIPAADQLGQHRAREQQHEIAARARARAQAERHESPRHVSSVEPHVRRELVRERHAPVVAMEERREDGHGRSRRHHAAVPLCYFAAVPKHERGRRPQAHRVEHTRAEEREFLRPGRGVCGSDLRPRAIGVAGVRGEQRQRTKRGNPCRIECKEPLRHLLRHRRAARDRHARDHAGPAYGLASQQVSVDSLEQPPPQRRLPRPQPGPVRVGPQPHHQLRHLVIVPRTVTEYHAAYGTEPRAREPRPGELAVGTGK